MRLRREGGSLSITIPRYIVRRWNLEPGARLVVRSTDEGVLLYPRYFLPYVDSTWLRDAVQADDTEPDDLDNSPDVLTQDGAWSTTAR